MSKGTRHDVQSGSLEAEVRRRYAAGAREVEPGLCCPREGDEGEGEGGGGARARAGAGAGAGLEILPQEILEKDYGCGDPSRHAREGETVLDLGCGAGKVCYLLSQRVGPRGRVIGVDFNDPMLELARKYQGEMAGRIGHDNVRFAKGRIQDLALDLEKAQAWLDRHPLRTVEETEAYEAECARLRRVEPLVPDASVDLVVSSCVLNLVRPEDKDRLFEEIARVLRRGGRAVVSDIVCDEEPTEKIRRDPELWSGCIAGAFREDEFLERFARAGLYGVEILSRREEPWRVIDGIEFRPMTVRAFKGKEGACFERNQAVVYKGPWSRVVDDDGHELLRGRRMAVCDKTYRILTDPEGPYAGAVVPLPPRREIPLEGAELFDCTRTTLRDPRETKGAAYRETRPDPGGAGPEETCCGESGCC